MKLISDRLLSRLLGSGRPECQIAPRGKTNWDLTTEPDLGKRSYRGWRMPWVTQSRSGVCRSIGPVRCPSFIDDCRNVFKCVKSSSIQPTQPCLFLYSPHNNMLLFYTPPGTFALNNVLSGIPSPATFKSRSSRPVFVEVIVCFCDLSRFLFWQIHSTLLQTWSQWWFCSSPASRSWSWGCRYRDRCRRRCYWLICWSTRRHRGRYYVPCL